MSNEKLGAEQGRETLQAIAQEIVANLGSCDASNDLGFKVIWATLDRHFGTGPKQAEQAEQAYHARGAGLTREQAVEFAERWFDRKWGNDGQYQSLMETMVKRLMELREPGADTGTRERLDEARWWHARIGLNHGMKWCCERIEELERAAAERGTTPPRETAWLIERHDMTRTQWLCCDSGEFEWTADPLKPLRLARREDAEQLALLALPNRDDIDVRITEHQWGM